MMTVDSQSGAAARDATAETRSPPKSLRKLFSKKLGLSKQSAAANNNKADRADEATSRESADVSHGREPPVANDESESDLTVAIEKEISELNDKGNDFFQKEEFDAALRMYSEALKVLKNGGGEYEGDKSASGMKRFRTARLLVNIGAVHIRRSDYDSAISVLELSMRSSKLVSPMSSYYYRACEVMADALENIGLVQFKKKDYGQSSVIYSEALEARRHCIELLSMKFGKQKGPRSKGEVRKHLEEINACKLDLANTLFYMCLLRERQGDIDDAINKCEESITLRREVFTNFKADSTSLNLCSAMGRLYCNNSVKRYQDALKYFHEVHRMKREIVGSNHLDIASALNNIGYLHLQLGDFKKCIEFSDRSIDIATNGRGLNKETCIAWTNKGEAQDMLGDHLEALSCYNKAIEIQTTYSDENDMIIAEVHEKMANTHLKQKDLNKAVSSLEKSILVKREILGPEKGELVASYQKLAEYHEMNGDYSGSIQCHTKALRICKHNDDKEGAAIEHNKIGGLLKKTGAHNKAMEHYMQALWHSRGAKLPSTNPIVADTIRNVATFQREL